MLGLQWQPARSLRASPVLKQGKMNSICKAALHCGIQQHTDGLHVSLDTTDPSGNDRGNDRAVGIGCIRRQKASLNSRMCLFMKLVCIYVECHNKTVKLPYIFAVGHV